MSGEKQTMTWEICGRGLNSNASVPLSDRGFRFGQHLFETIAVRGGRWLFYTEHLRILREGASEAGFRCENGAWEAILELPDALELKHCREGIARIFWTAGDGAPSSPPSAGRLFLFWEPQILPALQGHLRLLTEPFVFSPMSSARSHWKTGNYWQNVEARRQATARGCDEILLVNPKGEICSASMGNLFFKIGADWFTPPAGSCVRRGTTRGWLLSLGFAGEKQLKAADIPEVNCWMVTNSRLGPAVACVDGQQITADPALTQLWHLWMEI